MTSRPDLVGLQKHKLQRNEIPSPVVGPRYPRDAVDEVVEFIIYDELALNHEQQQEDEVDGADGGGGDCRTRRVQSPGHLEREKRLYAHTFYRHRHAIRDVLEAGMEVPEDNTDEAQVISETYKRKIKQRKEKGKKSRTKCDLTLDDLALKVDTELFPNTLKLKSSLYVWIIFLMGTFYTVPVLQLILGHQRSSRNSGNMDMCYYNFLCKVSVPYIEDFGHVFSNIAYVISGLVFIIMCAIRQRRYKR